MQKLPPYGKPLASLLQSGFKPNNDVYVIIGKHAWKKAHGLSISYPQRVLCLPPYECPSVYEWPVKQCDILLVNTGYGHDDYAQDVAFYLYQQGASLVHTITRDGDFYTFIR